MEAQLNRQHRDTLFRDIFITPKNFLYLLSRCSDGKSTLTEDSIKPFGLESPVAYRIRRNDVSFITNDNRLIILIEHQSTLCPNMALRLFMYYIELLQLWVKTNDVSLYGQQKIANLPLPELYVAYNGTKRLNDIYSTFKLEHTGIKIDVNVKIIDIRYDNLEDKETTNTLAGYSYFYKIYDECIKKDIPSKEAFETAREECIKQGYLQGFIDREDFIMFYKDILDYDTQLKEEGKAEGKAEGLLEAAISLVKKGTDIHYVIEALPLSDTQVTQLKQLTI